MTDLIDRRCSPRIPCDLAVDYQARGTRAQLGRMINIGTGGGLLATPGASLSIGIELLLRFQLPLSQRGSRTIGEIKWAIPERAGVQFVHFGLHEQDEIWRCFARESARQTQGAVRRPQPLSAQRHVEKLQGGMLAAWRRLIRERA